MAKPTTRVGLEDYCLRALGHPVIEINLDEDQMSDRIDEAIQYYQEYHGDAIVRNILKHQVTNSSLTVGSASNFSIGQTITGGTSGTKAVIASIPNSTTIRYNDVSVNGTAFVAETITSGSESTTVSAVTKGDLENGFVAISDTNMISIHNVFNINTHSSSNNLFSVDYQIHLQDIFDLNGATGGIINYELTKQYMSLLDRNLNGVYEMIEWSRHKNIVNFHSTTLSDVGVGNYIVFDGLSAIDPDTYTDVYNDMFLKRYTTALFKRQWGTNLKKFTGMQLPGGVEINGQQIFDEANEEITQIEEQMQLKYEMPPLDFIG